jgi:hypothetical protein
MAELRAARSGDREEIRRIDVATWSPRVTPGPPPDGERDLLDRFGAENVIVAEAGEGAGRLPEARRLYESRGFEVEAVLPESFLLEGAYVDDVFMALDLT